MNFEWLTNSFKKTIYAPGGLSCLNLIIDVVRTCEPQLRDSKSTALVLDLSSDEFSLWKETQLRAFLQDNDLDQQVVLLRSLTPSAHYQLMRLCHLLFVAHLGLEPRNLSLALDSSLRAGQAAIVTPQQIHFIQNSIKQDVSLLRCELGRPLFRELTSVTQLTSQYPAADSVSIDSINELNRAYSFLLQKRR